MERLRYKAERAAWIYVDPSGRMAADLIWSGVADWSDDTIRGRSSVGLLIWNYDDSDVAESM